jgi:hypothetical protein
MRELVTLALAIGVLVAIPVLVWLLLRLLGVDFSPDVGWRVAPIAGAVVVDHRLLRYSPRRSHSIRARS